MRRVLQQGNADGLCGLYCILNFLERQGWGRWVDNSLQTLLEAAQQIGCFTPHHIADGFYDYQLKAILDLQITNFRMSFETFYLRDVQETCEEESYRRLLQRVVAKGGSAIVLSEAGRSGHWLLITKISDEVLVLDSDDQQNSRTLLSERKLRSSDWGVVILPLKRSLLTPSI